MTGDGPRAGAPWPPTLLVLAKRPVPGRVKTRLCPPLTPVQAATVAAAALHATLGAVAGAPARQRVLVLDDAPGAWLPTGWRALRQVGGGLDRRLGAAFAAVAADGPALLVGMDTPHLGPEHLTGFDAGAFDACLGPARDGGYWAIGFADPALAPRAIEGVPMSSAVTAAEQLSRLRRLGLRVQLLPELVDVDTVADAVEVAALCRALGRAAGFADVVAEVTADPGADRRGARVSRPIHRAG